MRVYIHDQKEGDQRDPHDSGQAVSLEDLDKLGVLYYHHDDMESVDKIAEERGYVNRDVINITPEGLGGQEIYEQKLKTFYAEHLHEDEEIRYILDGEGYFDVRHKDDENWIRIEMTKGDLIILPSGIYHRFTLSNKDYIKAMRLFQAEPKWIAYNRPDADSNPYRETYVQKFLKV